MLRDLLRLERQTPETPLLVDNLFLQETRQEYETSAVQQQRQRELETLLQLIDGLSSLPQPQESSSFETQLLLSGTVLLQPQPQESSSEPPPVAAYAVLPDETEELLALGPACPICLVDYIHGEAIQCPQRCRHAFHPHCLTQWLEFSTTRRQQVCPCCRASIGTGARNSVISPGLAHAPPRSRWQDSMYFEEDDDDDNDVPSDAAVATTNRRRRRLRPRSSETPPWFRRPEHPALDSDFGDPIVEQQRWRRRRTGTPPRLPEEEMPIVASRHAGEGQSDNEQPSSHDGRWSERTASPLGGVISGEETSVRAGRNHSPEQRQHTASPSELRGSEDDDDDVPSDDTVVSGLRPSLHHDRTTETPPFFPEHTTQLIVTPVPLQAGEELSDDEPNHDGVWSERSESPLGGVDSAEDTSVRAGSNRSPEQQQDNHDYVEPSDDDAMVTSLEQSWHHHLRTETPPPRFQILEDMQLVTPPSLRHDDKPSVEQTHDGMFNVHTPEQQQQSMLVEDAPPPPSIPRLWGGIHTALEAARDHSPEQRSQMRHREEAPPSPLRLWGGIHPTP